MSGIVGIVALNGEPVDVRQLRRLTASLRFRGPDGNNIWIDRSVGFGHTSLQTTFEARNESQPCCLDDDLWMVADARVDGRSALIRKLKAGDRSILPGASDPELILHAYALWGRGCVHHLIGDYAFAIWDGNRRQLFCARDHLGVKPFYYAVTQRCLLFSNTLDCLRIHPEVSDELNECAVGDFLLFGYNQDQASTSFADIRRLPGGHALSCTGGDLQIERYWEPPVDGYIRYKDPEGYSDHFLQLFRSAVADRLRVDGAAVLMSGGLDSTSVAAAAHSLLSERGTNFKLGAFTTVYDRLLPDDERRYAGLLAERLHIPADFNAADDYPLLELRNRTACRRPEPVYEPGLNAFADQLKRISAKYRVVLTGWDGDAFLNEPASRHFARLLGGGNLRQWLVDAGAYVRRFGRRPPLGLRRILAQAFGGPAYAGFEVPSWLDPAFARRIDAPTRVREFAEIPDGPHPRRPAAHGALSLPVWSQIFEFYDAGATGLPLEARHPFVDLRLVEFLLAIPAVPFCIDKHLLRNAMRGVLPEAIRLRPKSPMAADPILFKLRNADGARLKNYRPSAELSRFVAAEGILDHIGEMDSEKAEAALRVVSLDLWLNGLKLKNEAFQSETVHEHRSRQRRQETPRRQHGGAGCARTEALP